MVCLPGAAIATDETSLPSSVVVATCSEVKSQLQQSESINHLCRHRLFPYHAYRANRVSPHLAIHADHLHDAIRALHHFFDDNKGHILRYTISHPRNRLGDHKRHIGHSIYPSFAGGRGGHGGTAVAEPQLLSAWVERLLVPAGSAWGGGRLQDQFDHRSRVGQR